MMLNKNQRTLLKYLEIVVANEKIDVKNIFSYANNYFRLCLKNEAQVFSPDSNELKIEQQKNQNDGTLIIAAIGLERIVTVSNNIRKNYEMQSINNSQIKFCCINFDFNNKIEKLIFYFNYDLAEPLEVNAII